MLSPIMLAVLCRDTTVTGARGQVSKGWRAWPPTRVAWGPFVDTTVGIRRTARIGQANPWLP